MNVTIKISPAVFNLGCSVRSISCSGDGKLLACTDRDGVIWILDAKCGTALSRCESEIFRHGAVYYRGGLATFCNDGRHPDKQGVLLRRFSVPEAHIAADGSVAALCSVAIDAELLVALVTEQSTSDGNNHVIFVDGTRARCDREAVAVCGGGAMAAMMEAIFVGARERGTIEVVDITARKVARRFAVSPSGVRAIAISSDGRIGASAHWDECGVRVWDASSGVKLAAAVGCQGKVNSLAFSLQGSLLATCDVDGHFHILDISRMETIYVDNFSSRIETMAFSPDRRVIYLGGEEGIHRVEFESQGQFQTLRATAAVTHLGWLNDETHIVVGRRMGGCEIWDVKTQERIKQIADGSVLSITSDGMLVAVATSTGGLDIWSCSTGEIIDSVPHNEGRLTAACFSEDGELLAISGNGSTVWIWDIANRKTVRVFKIAASWANQLLFLDGGKWLVALEPSLPGEADTNMVHGWCLHSGKTCLRLRCSPDTSAIAMSADATILVIGGYDGKLTVMRGSALSFKSQYTIKMDGKITSISVTMDKLHFAAGYDDRGVDVFRTSDGRAVSQLATDTVRDQALAFSSTSEKLAVGSANGEVRICSMWKG